MLNDPTVVVEWDSETFHRHVLALEAEGFVARLETYSITPEMNPETGEIVHVHSIEMGKSQQSLTFREEEQVPAKPRTAPENC